MKNYAVTLKFQDNDVTHTEKDYFDILNGKWHELGVNVRDLHFEKDSRDMLHLHCIASMPDGLYHPRLKTEGLQPYIKPLINEKGWLIYIKKQILT